MNIQVETITPEKAQEMLALNTGNFRDISKKRVESIAVEMKKGNWALNGETIKFNGSKLIDGQHRLAAVVKSGVTIQSAVAYDCDLNFIDRGQARTIAQHLRREGVKNYTKVATVSRLCLVHNKGLWHRSSVHPHETPDSEIIDFAMEHHQSISNSIAHGTPKGLSQTYVTSVLFLGSGMKDASKNTFAQWFRDGLVFGSGLQETDAVLHLRNRISDQGDKISHFMKRMLLTVAWNKTVQGEECTASGLRIRLSGPRAQKLPQYLLVAEE